MTNDSASPLDDFKDFYLIYICPFVNFPVCAIGSILNVLNIIVFQRKAMSSAMNTIFLHLSIVEFGALVINIPLTWHVCVEHKDLQQHVLHWEIFHFFARCSTTLLFYVSVWFTVMLTIWRYLSLAHPILERNWCNAKTTRMVLIAGYIFGILLTLPSYISLHIEEDKNNHNITIQFKEDGVPYYIHFVLYGTVLKLVPSVILTIFSYKLIKALSAIKKKGESRPRSRLGDEQKISNMKQRTDFTTRMLFGVLVLFLITEVPSGILGLLSIIKGKEFRKHYFSPMIHVFNTIRLISIAISFFIYYNLSQQFRNTFKGIFKREEYQISNSRESRTSEI